MEEARTPNTTRAIAALENLRRLSSERELNIYLDENQCYSGLVAEPNPNLTTHPYHSSLRFVFRTRPASFCLRTFALAVSCLDRSPSGSSNGCLLLMVQISAQCHLLREPALAI